MNVQIKQANEIFLQPWGMMEIETLENKKIEIENYNISIFNLCLDHAKTLQERAITFINQTLWGKNKALEDAKNVIDEMITPFEEVKKDEIIIIDTPMQQNQSFVYSKYKEAFDGIQNVKNELDKIDEYSFIGYEKTTDIIEPNATMNFAFYDGEQIPLDESFVPYEKENTNKDEKMIVAKFKINGTTGLSNDEVLTAIRDILFDAGICDDSLVSLEVL